VFTPIVQVTVSDRQRKEITSKELIELKRSIVSKGLFHAPVMSQQSETSFQLIAGERRLRAMTELHEEGFTFTYNGTVVPINTIPYVLISDLSLADLKEAELEENILRAQLTWLEEAEAKAKIHALRTEIALSAGEKEPTQISTAKHILAIKQKDTSQKAVNNERAELSKAIMVAKNKNIPTVQAAKNLSQAYAAVLAAQENEFKALLAEKTSSIEDSLKLIHGDCLEELKLFPPETFDIIFTDPPYGINADTMKHDSKHFYSDTPENALHICKTIISEGFRITKLKATLFMWCDVEHYLTLREYASMQGWTVWRAPLVWHKGIQGHAPWGRAGFIRTYEFLLFAVKGQRELFISGGPDVVTIRSTATTKKTHAAEKPFEILEYFLSRAALQGDHVLDPCCGSGAIFKAAKNLKLKATGIEISEDYHKLAMSNLGDIRNGAESSVEDKDPLDELDLA